MSKILKAEYQGKLNIGNIQIPCAVLEDKTRVLSERSLAKAFGSLGSGAYWKKRRKGDVKALLPRYISMSYLEGFIDNELRTKLLNPIIYKSVASKESLGMEASILPEICDVWIKANEGGTIPKTKSHIPDRAYILLKGFAYVGIIALVDEATGYQEVRNKDELHKILKAYIAPELMPWTERFPPEFYKQIFRLNNWIYNPMSVKRPQVLGTWTNTYIYKRLPPGVLEELKKQTPKDSKGRRKHQYHRLLTEDIGNPHLEKQIASVIPIMRLSTTWRKFKENFAKAFQIGQKTLELEEESED